MKNKPIAIGLVFGIGMGLALNSWLLGIMFGIIFYVALNEAEKRKQTKWNAAGLDSLHTGAFLLYQGQAHTFLHIGS